MRRARSAAVAAFGMLLRDSPHKGDATWRMVADLGRQHRGADDDGYRSQFVRLAEVTAGLSASVRRGER
jgi:Ca-activated chloride channel family protein